MRIMIDTNVLISAILFPNSPINEVMKVIAEKHKLILCSFVIEELLGVEQRKFLGKKEAVDRFLSEFPYRPRCLFGGGFFMPPKGTESLWGRFSCLAATCNILVTI